MLRVDALVAGYRSGATQRIVVPALSTTVRPGHLVCLLGPNGAGKSTLMHTIGGSLAPLAGRVWLGDRDLHALAPRARAQSVAIVTTERVTAPLLTGWQLVALGRQPHTGWFGTLTDEDRARVDHALRLAAATDVAPRPIGDLSDGERQRLLLARALAQSDQLLLLDELTAFLDLPRRVDVMRVLRQLARESGCAVVLSTHDLDLALRTADRLWLLPRGGPLQVGAPEDLVLSGAFRDAFAADGIEFDAHDGAFRLPDARVRAVSLEGEGLALRWTARALERAGFRVQSQRGDQVRRVRVVAAREGTRWQLDDGAPLASIAELIDGLP
ncbi:MAG: ABC transporter ATP-binding protein [Gemmatimonadaceae bacterium]|jgi:iron complex transport system ATP-binding protein|nr:ABC transporter ATP-binding protein [Gemmatimonadaceae bacterium]